MDVGERRQPYSGPGDSLVLGVEFAAAPLLFGLIGHALDGRFGTRPWLTIFLVVFALTGLVVRAYYGYVAAMDRHQSGAPWAKAQPLEVGQPAPGADPALRAGLMRRPWSP